MRTNFARFELAIFLICLQPFEMARAEVARETVCYVSTDVKSVRFEFHTYFDSNRKWSGGFAKYENSSELIPLVLVPSATVGDWGREISEPSTKWLEIWNGKVSGEYVLKREGAGTGVSGYVATYRNYASKKERNFVLDAAAGFEEAGCNWTR